MRASTIPLLENEPLVVVRASFLALCDGDHCAAALLNDFVYWHDWCVTHGRYDAVASDADADHQGINPEYWFWKTTEGLVQDDLLRLWGEKKVRAAAELLEAKGYAASRFNPKDRHDRTKQYRLLQANLSAALQRWVAGHSASGSARSAEVPFPSGKNAECTHSTTCSDPPIRQKCRMHSAKLPNVLTETTHSEITQVCTPSSSVQAPSEQTGKRTRMEPSPDESTRHLASDVEGQEAPSTRGEVVLTWAEERHIRRRRDDRSYGGPDQHWAEQWTLYCAERSIRDREEIFRVLDAAKAAADAREPWRFWKYLDEQVQQAAERYPPQSLSAPTRIPEPMPSPPAEDPASEWACAKRGLVECVSPITYGNWIKLTRQVERNGTKLLVWVPDEITRDWLEQEYASLISATLSKLGITAVEYVHGPIVVHQAPAQEGS